MFAFQTDIDLETGIDIQSTAETAVEAIEADDMINGGYNNDGIHSSIDGTDDADNENEESTTLFIYQRTFNPNEGMNSLESEDQDTLKEDSEATTVANQGDDKDEPDVESADGEEAPQADVKLEDQEVDVELEDQEADVELEDQEPEIATNDENNNENDFDPELIDEEVASEEIKALTNDIEEDEANDEVIV